jgi:hypothetical protein
MAWRRRDLLALLATPGAGLMAQGVASRGVRALPRGKPSGLPFNASFIDVAAAAGLTAPTIHGSPGRAEYILETIGCGAAFLDYDNDGWVDILILSGQTLEGVPEGATNRLYKNNRDGTFTDVTKQAGLLRGGWASAVCVADYNNDGYDDLFITYWGQNVLYRNNGDGTFTDVTKEAGLLRPETRWGAGCTFLDYDRDGHVDLFISNYLKFDLDSVPKPGETSLCVWKGVPVLCGPRGLPHEGHLLYHNNGDGTFTDVSVKSGIAAAMGSYGMTAAAADFDNDGWPDIYVACDSTVSLFFRNNHDGTFTESGLEQGIAVSEDGMQQAGMGLGIGDFKLDGNLDIFKTHFADDTNVLYRNDGEGIFDDLTVRSGLAVETRYVGWGAGMVDLDNDGWPDLFFVTGNVYPNIGEKLAGYPYKTPRVIFRNLDDGKFEELLDLGGPAIPQAHSSRGCAFGDFDNDGDVDVLIVNLHEPPSLLRNDVKGGGNWLKVKLAGVRSNRGAIGATVIVHYGGRKQAQAVLSQGSFYSANDSRLHFGLGKETTADVEIRWPNGAKEKVAGVEANRLVIIKEGFGVVVTKIFG